MFANKGFYRKDRHFMICLQVNACARRSCKCTHLSERYGRI